MTLKDYLVFTPVIVVVTAVFGTCSTSMHCATDRPSPREQQARELSDKYNVPIDEVRGAQDQLDRSWRSQR
jgi:hypothetical protein